MHGFMREWGETFNPTAALMEFETKVVALESTADWAEVVELARRFHGPYERQLDEIKSFIGSGMEWQRAEVLKGIKELADVAGDARVLGRWMKEWRKQYGRKLATPPQPPAHR